MTTFIHPTAVVSPDASLGPGTQIWHFAHIREGARIGPDCNLGQNVYVAPSVRLGRGVKVQNNVSLFDGVLLDDFVFCGPSAVFTNVKTPRSEVSRRHEYLPTHVHRGASIGANATIICGITIGTYAMIGAGTTITRDVPPFALMVGTPARQIGWSCRCGHTLTHDLHLPTGSTLTCSACQATYHLHAPHQLSPTSEIPA